MPRPRSDQAGLHIDLNRGRGAATLGSGAGRSPVLVPDRSPPTTDLPVERQPGPSRRVCPLIGRIGRRSALPAVRMAAEITPLWRSMGGASLEIAAGPGPIFELIADPALQPRWDGNDNLAGAPAGQRSAAPVMCS